MGPVLTRANCPPFLSHSDTSWESVGEKEKGSKVDVDGNPEANVPAKMVPDGATPCKSLHTLLP